MHFDDPSDTMPVIDSILQLHQVKASLCARFFVIEELSEDDDVQHQHSLKIDAISDWLHQQVHQPSLPYYRTLEIQNLTLYGKMLLVRLDSVERLIETLKMVSLSILFFHSLLFVVRVEFRS